MRKEFTDFELMYELEPIVEANINRHLGVTKGWNPHDYIPWSEGKNYQTLGGQDWNPEPLGARQLHDARLHDPRLPPQCGSYGSGRHLRPSAAPRRGRHAGAARVA